MHHRVLLELGLDVTDTRKSTSEGYTRQLSEKLRALKERIDKSQTPSFMKFTISRMASVSMNPALHYANPIKNQGPTDSTSLKEAENLLAASRDKSQVATAVIETEVVHDFVRFADLTEAISSQEEYCRRMSPPGVLPEDQFHLLSPTPTKASIGWRHDAAVSDDEDDIFSDVLQGGMPSDIASRAHKPKRSRQTARTPSTRSARRGVLVIDDTYISGPERAAKNSAAGGMSRRATRGKERAFARHVVSPLAGGQDSGAGGGRASEKDAAASALTAAGPAASDRRDGPLVAHEKEAVGSAGERLLHMGEPWDGKENTYSNGAAREGEAAVEALGRAARTGEALAAAPPRHVAQEEESFGPAKSSEGPRAGVRATTAAGAVVKEAWREGNAPLGRVAASDSSARPAAPSHRQPPPQVAEPFPSPASPDQRPGLHARESLHSVPRSQTTRLASYASSPSPFHRMRLPAATIQGALVSPSPSRLPNQRDTQIDLGRPSRSGMFPSTSATPSALSGTRRLVTLQTTSRPLHTRSQVAANDAPPRPSPSLSVFESDPAFRPVETVASPSLAPPTDLRRRNAAGIPQHTLQLATVDDSDVSTASQLPLQTSSAEPLPSDEPRHELPFVPAQEAVSEASLEAFLIHQARHFRASLHSLLPYSYDAESGWEAAQRAAGFSSRRVVRTGGGYSVPSESPRAPHPADVAMRRLSTRPAREDPETYRTPDTMEEMSEYLRQLQEANAHYRPPPSEMMDPAEFEERLRMLREGLDGDTSTRPEDVVDIAVASCESFLDTLRLKERKLVELQREAQHQRSRGPVPNWYGIADKRFNAEMHRHSRIVRERLQASLSDVVEDSDT